MKEKTIANNLIINGIGLHSGKKVSIEFIPSHCGYIYFSDKNNHKKRLKTLFDNVVDTNLGTTIANAEMKILTIEHLMAALWACDINSLEIRIDGSEIPILDGSSFKFIEKIKSVGVSEIEKYRKYLIIKKEVVVGDTNRFIKIFPSDSFSINMKVQYDYGAIGEQHFIFSGQKDYFVDEISKARTFCREKDVENMRKIGLIKGGSLDNSVVFGENGPINEMNLRYKDEVVRHKILDCVGDLYSCGFNIVGKIEAYKSGHTLDNQLVRKIFGDNHNYLIE